MLINIPHFDIPNGSSETPWTSPIELLIVSDAMSGEDADLLTKILGATGLTSAQYHVLDDTTKIRLAKLPEDHRPKYILLFDKNGEAIGVQAKLKSYQPTSLIGSTVMSVDALTDIGRTKQLKLALWQHLKNWFVDG